MEQTLARLLKPTTTKLVTLIAAVVCFFGIVSQVVDHQTPSDQLQSDELPSQQPTKTSNWFSSFYSFPSHPVFSLPGAFQITQEGFTVSSPMVTATPGTVFGSFTPDCLVSLSGPIDSSRVARYGDWNVIVELTSADTKAEISITKGSPIVYIKSSSNSPNFSCSNSPQINNQTIIFSAPPKSILLEAQQPESISDNNQTISLKALSDQFRLAILPDTNPETIELFTNEPWNPIIDTQVTWSQTNQTIETQYHFNTQTQEAVVTTLWPHQLPFTTSHAVLGKYPTSQGELTLTRLNSFTTKLPTPDLPFSFSPVTNPQAQQAIKSAINRDLEKFQQTPPAGGVYFFGTELGARTSLIQLADAYDLTDQRNQTLDLLQSALIDALANNFTYDSNRKILIAKQDEFGNSEGNDHHFHYSYYIRAAAVLAHFRPETIKDLEPTIDLMLQDIATTDRFSQKAPRLRHFSAYDSHSWADGDANFGDGNNQESTSEALNAWYAIKLWGDVTKNKDYQELGTWLFSQELEGTKTYWFGHNNPYPTGYNHPMASIVWGGKRDFGTWFSGEAMHIYGIQFLPITPASNYLATLSTPLLTDQIKQHHPTPTAHEWGDLYTIFLSFHNPTEAISLLPQVKTSSGAKLESLLWHTVYANNQ